MVIGPRDLIYVKRIQIHSDPNRMKAKHQSSLLLHFGLRLCENTIQFNHVDFLKLIHMTNSISVIFSPFEYYQRQHTVR